MSRHRNIRSMNVHDEYEGYDDVYGHSVEDDYGVSPATEAQFMYRRSEAPRLSSFIEESKKESIEEEEEYDYDDDHDHSLSDSQTFQWPRLSDHNEARLRSCLEEIQNVIGDSVPQHVLVDTVLRCDYDLEKALDAVLSLQDKPKETRPPPAAAAPPRTQEHTSVDIASPFGLLEQGLTTVIEVPTSKSQCSTATPPTDIPPLLQSSLYSISPSKSTLPTVEKNLLNNSTNNVAKTGSSPVMSLSQLANANLGSIEISKTVSPDQSTVGLAGNLKPNALSSETPSNMVERTGDVNVSSVGSHKESGGSAVSLSQLANLHLGNDETIGISPLQSAIGNLGGTFSLTQQQSIGGSNVPTLGALSSKGQPSQAIAASNTTTFSSLTNSLSSLAMSVRRSESESLKAPAHGPAPRFSTTERSGRTVGKQGTIVASSEVLSSSAGLLSTPLSQLSSSPLGSGLGSLSKNKTGSLDNSPPTETTQSGLFSSISQLSGSGQSGGHSALSALADFSRMSGGKDGAITSRLGQGTGLVNLGSGLSSSSGMQSTMQGRSKDNLGAVSLSDYQLFGQGFSGGSLDDLGPLGSQLNGNKLKDANRDSSTLPGNALSSSTSSNTGSGSLGISGTGALPKVKGTVKNSGESSVLQLSLSSLCSTAGDTASTGSLSGIVGTTPIDLSTALKRDEPRPLHLTSNTQPKTSSCGILPVSQQLSEKTHEVEDRPVSPFYHEQKIVLPKEAVARPSPFARALCCKDCHYKQARNHPKFLYQHQQKGQRSVSPVQVAQIVPFDFSTPSPDDVVKEKQKEAFTRPND